MRIDTKAPGAEGTVSIGLPPALRTFLRVALILLAIALICEAISTFVLHLGYPYRSPLLSEYFPDLITLQPRFQHFHTLQFFTDNVDAFCMYPAPVAVCYKIFFLFVPHDIGTFLFFVISCFVI